MLSLAILVAMFVTGGPDAQAKKAARTATLAVLVSDPAGAPVGGVMVRVGGSATRSARTERGRIVFENLPPGPYRLRFEREGFVTLERELTARAGALADVNVTLTPAPAPEPVPEPPPPAPAPPPPPPVDVEPVTLDMPALIEKEFIGRGAVKTTPLACAPGGAAELIQVREPLGTHAHADADEFLYVIAGEGIGRLSGRQERLRAGMFLLVPRGVPHTLSATGRNPLMVLSTRAGEPCTPLQRRTSAGESL